MLDETIERYRAPALDKGLDILELLAESHDGMTQTEIAKALGRPATEFYRMLERLVRRNYVARVSGDRYGLTMKMFALANRNPPMHQLIGQATPVMRRLAGECMQACHLVVLDRGDLVLVAQVESPKAWGVSIRIGTKGGLANTGSGRVMLAFATAPERRRMLSEHQTLPGELILAGLDAQLDAIRTRGYEAIESPQMTGVHLLSAPIIGLQGSAFAAITITHLGRTDVADALDPQRCVPMLLQAGRDISAIVAGEL